MARIGLLLLSPNVSAAMQDRGPVLGVGDDRLAQRLSREIERLSHSRRPIVVSDFGELFGCVTFYS